MIFTLHRRYTFVNNFNWVILHYFSSIHNQEKNVNSFKLAFTSSQETTGMRLVTRVKHFVYLGTQNWCTIHRG